MTTTQISPSLCDCGDVGAEIWLQNFGCGPCDARKISKFVSFDVQRTLNEGGQGTLSFPLDQVGSLDEVWPNQTAVVIKVCGSVKFAGVVKELNLDAGVISLGLQTWDEWLKDRYIHTDLIFGDTVVKKYNAKGEVVKEPGVDEIWDLKIPCDVTSGTFILRFQNVETDPIPVGANASRIENDLIAISTIDNNEVDVTGGGGCPRVYKIHFQNGLGEQNIKDADFVVLNGPTDRSGDNGHNGSAITLDRSRDGQKSSGKEITCVIDGPDMTASEAVCNLITYAGQTMPAHDPQPEDDVHPGNGVFEEPFCVPCIRCVVQAPNTKDFDGYWRYCSGTTIAEAIEQIRAQKGIEWVTDALQGDDGCWCFRFIVSDHIGSTNPYPVRLPGTALNIKPYTYDALTILSGKQCYPPPCPGAPAKPAGSTQWGGCYNDDHKPRAIREALISKDAVAAKGTTSTSFGQDLRDDACESLDNNPPRDIVTARVVLGNNDVCMPGLGIGDYVSVDLGSEGGCFTGTMRVRGETFSADADGGLTRELQLDPIPVRAGQDPTTQQRLFTTDCDTCPDCGSF